MFEEVNGLLAYKTKDERVFFLDTDLKFRQSPSEHTYPWTAHPLEGTVLEETASGWPLFVADVRKLHILQAAREKLDLGRLDEENLLEILEEFYPSAKPKTKQPGPRYVFSKHALSRLQEMQLSLEEGMRILCDESVPERLDKNQREYKRTKYDDTDEIAYYRSGTIIFTVKTNAIDYRTGDQIGLVITVTDQRITVSGRGYKYAKY